MWEDPIVAEVHRTRERLAAKFGFDIDAIFADLRKRQVALGDRLVPHGKWNEPAVDVNQVGQAGFPDATASESTPAK